MILPLKETFSEVEGDIFFLLKKDVVRSIFHPMFNTLAQLATDIKLITPSLVESYLDMRNEELTQISMRIRWFMKLAFEFRLWTPGDFLNICELDPIMSRLDALPQTVRNFIKYNLFADVDDENVGVFLLIEDEEDSFPIF